MNIYAFCKLLTSNSCQHQQSSSKPLQELINFKSYAGTKTIGPFHKRFSSVVGPNGSGKSNVIDAMLFVFGKRAKKLRLNKVSEWCCLHSLLSITHWITSSSLPGIGTNPHKRLPHLPPLRPCQCPLCRNPRCQQSPRRRIRLVHHPPQHRNHHLPHRPS